MTLQRTQDIMIWITRYSKQYRRLTTRALEMSRKGCHFVGLQYSTPIKTSSRYPTRSKSLDFSAFLCRIIAVNSGDQTPSSKLQLHMHAYPAGSIGPSRPLFPRHAPLFRIELRLISICLLRVLLMDIPERGQTNKYRLLD